MPRVTVPLDSGFYVSDSLPVAAQECVNYYVNIPQTQGALSNATLRGCSGVSAISTTGGLTQVNRGSHVKAGVPYFVNGNSIYRLDRELDDLGNEQFTPVDLGEIEGEGRVSTADNGTQLMVLVPGGKGYILDETQIPNLQEITDGDFYANGQPQIVTFIDSFFVCTTDSKKFIKSAANDGTNWNALDFGSAESDPDDIVSIVNHKNKLYVAGSETIEEFTNRGVGGFPFQRTNFFLDKGVFAPFSMVETNDSFMFIGGGVNESPAVWALAGNSLQKVSTTAIDAALQNFSNEEIKKAFAYTYAQNGAYFVGFSLPTRTFEINTITGKWNERKSQIVNSKGLTEVIRWRINSIVTAYNKVLCGDSQDGRIGAVEVDTYSEYNSNIVRSFATQPLSDQGNSVTVSQVELTMESGVGNLEALNPKIMMDFSHDAKIYSNELWRDVGGVGYYSQRSIWRRLGRFARFSVFRFKFSEKVKPEIIKLELNLRAHNVGN